MKYFVTGGAGFIGSNYVRMLLTEKLGAVTSVTVLDNLTYAGKLSNLDGVKHDSRFKFIKGDISDKNLIRKILESDDVLVHFAAESHVDKSIDKPSVFAATNILGTQSLLDVSLEKGIQLFLHVSTDEVYGSISTGHSTEESNLLPNSPYSASKAASDLIVRSYVQTYGLDARITRCSNNYGPNQNREKFIPTVLGSLFSGGKIPVYGNGKNVREWIHVEDHCLGIQNVIQSGVKGEIYNIGSEESHTNLEVIYLLAKNLGINNFEIEFVKDRKGHDFRYSLDSSKIRTKLNFKPTKQIETSIKEFAHLYSTSGITP